MYFLEDLTICLFFFLLASVDILLHRRHPSCLVSCIVKDKECHTQNGILIYQL